MSWRREVPAVSEAAAGPSLRSRWSGRRGCDRRPCRPAPGVESAPCQPPQSVPMAGSGCAWGAEPPRFLEAFGRLWQVQSRLGSGSSASVYRVRCCGTPGSPPGALKQFLPPGTTGAAASAAEYGFRKERAALEQLQGHRNIGNCRCLPSCLAQVPVLACCLSAWRSVFRLLGWRSGSCPVLITGYKAVSHPPFTLQYGEDCLLCS